jgi:hypothetical protein
LVTATAVGVAAFTVATVATVVAVVDAVVFAVAVVAAVAAEVAAVAAVAVDWLFAAPTAMNPVRRAAAVTPPIPAARRARRAGCGRRRRLIWCSFPVLIEVFLSARSLDLSR